MTDLESVFGRAPRTVKVVGTPDGAAVITDMSQEQLDALLSQPGTVAWEIFGQTMVVASVKPDGSTIPVAKFNLRRRKHRMALRDVLSRGTLHVCAAESVAPDGWLEGRKLAVDVREADRFMIRAALGRSG